MINKKNKNKKSNLAIIRGVFSATSEFEEERTEPDSEGVLVFGGEVHHGAVFKKKKKIKKNKRIKKKLKKSTSRG